jgi:hypothetical protein
MVVEQATNWLTTWTTYAIFGQVIIRFTKLPPIVCYKVGSNKCKPFEKEYIALTSMRVFIVLLLVSLARSRISAIFFYWEKK